VPDAHTAGIECRIRAAMNDECRGGSSTRKIAVGPYGCRSGRNRQRDFSDHPDHPEPDRQLRKRLGATSSLYADNRWPSRPRHRRPCRRPGPLDLARNRRAECRSTKQETSRCAGLEARLHVGLSFIDEGKAPSGDSWAILCRGQQPQAEMTDHGLERARFPALTDSVNEFGKEVPKPRISPRRIIKMTLRQDKR